jgi:protein-disulfide isomerase
MTLDAIPLTGIHPHALAAAAAAEAAARQGRFWDMHGLLFHRRRHSTTTTCTATPPS